MHSPWVRKYIVICLLILLWESTEAESFFAVNKKTDPTIDDVMKVIQSQIRLRDIQKEMKVDMKWVSNPRPTVRLFSTSTLDQDLIIEIPKQDFDSISDSKSSSIPKKMFNFRKDKVALFSLSKNMAETQMFPGNNCNCSRNYSKERKAAVSCPTKERKTRVHNQTFSPKTEAMEEITENATGEQNEQNTRDDPNEDDDECLTEMTLVELLHDSDKECEKSAAEEPVHPESGKDVEEEHKTDSQLNDHNEMDNSTTWEKDGDNQLDQPSKEEKEEEEKLDEQLNKPSDEEAEEEEKADPQLSQVGDEDKEDCEKIDSQLNEQSEDERKEDESTDSQLNDMEDEQELADLPEANKSEYSTNSVEDVGRGSEAETTSTRRSNGKQMKQSTRQPCKTTQGRNHVTPKSLSFVVKTTKSYSKRPSQEYEKCASAKKGPAIITTKKYSGRQKNKKEKNNIRTDLKKRTRGTRTKKSINKSNIFLRKNLFLDNNDRKLLKRKYVKKNGNSTRSDSLKELISQIRRLTSVVPGQFQLSQNAERKWIDELEDMDDCDYGDDYIDGDDEEMKTECCVTPTLPSLPPELQAVQKMDTSDVRSMESVARRIYQAARSLRTNIEVKEEGIKKIEEEERLLTTGITNLQDILHECQTLKAGLNSVRSKSVARLRGLLQASEIQNQVHVKLANKIKEILRILDTDSINERLKHT